MSDYKISVAQNICSDLPPCAGYIAPVEGALTCTPIGDITDNGFPRAGGRIQFQLYSDPCGVNPNPALNICFPNNIQLPLCAAQPAYGKEYNPTKWITPYGYFSSRLSADNTTAQFRVHAELTVPDKEHINVQVWIDYLTVYNGTNVWQYWLGWTNLMDRVGPYQKIQGMAYQSNPQYFHVQPGGDGPCCEVSWVNMIAGIEPLLYACGTAVGDVDTCGMWNGNYFYTCFRGEVFDKTGTIFPKPFMCAFNSSTCGSPLTTYCGCDRCVVTSISPNTYDCRLNTDPTFIDYVYTGYEAVNDVQEIQLGQGSFPLETMVKSVNGALWFYWRDPAVSPAWSRSAGTLVQAYGPTIYSVEDANWRILFYATRYPSPEIVPDCTQPIPYQTVEPEGDALSGLNLPGWKPSEKLMGVPVSNHTSDTLKRIKLVMANPCANLGDQIEQQRGCSCNQSPKYACKLYGECYKYTSNDSVRACAKCDSYEPSQPLT